MLALHRAVARSPSLSTLKRMPLQTFPVRQLATSSAVQTAIQDHNVTVFSKTTCGFCAAAKKYLQTNGFEPYVIELNLEPDGLAWHEELKSLTGQRTVPYVFVKQELIGGHDDTVGMPLDELKSLAGLS